MYLIHILENCIVMYYFLRVTYLVHLFTVFQFTVELRFNEPLNNEVLDLNNDFLNPINGKIYGKSLDTTKPRYSEHILSVPEVTHKKEMKI